MSSILTVKVNTEQYQSTEVRTLRFVHFVTGQWVNDTDSLVTKKLVTHFTQRERIYYSHCQLESMMIVLNAVLISLRYCMI